MTAKLDKWPSTPQTHNTFTKTQQENWDRTHHINLSEDGSKGGKRTSPYATKNFASNAFMPFSTKSKTKLLFFS